MNQIILPNQMNCGLNSSENLVASPLGSPWTVESWNRYPIDHSLPFEKNEELLQVLGRLKSLPPLVCSDEIDRLRSELKSAEEGSCFVLQGGDCAERFTDCESGAIVDRLKVLLQMAVQIESNLRLPVVILGRMAGQYAKPRTSRLEKTSNGQTVLTYHGDMCHGFLSHERQPDPERVRKAYDHSALTLNFIRALLASDLSQVAKIPEFELSWKPLTPSDVRLMPNPSHENQKLRDGRNFELGKRFFVSHEGLFLPFEQALTRQVPRKEGYYDLSSHMIWIGDKTRKINGAHVEFFRGVRNPVGVKIGPSTTPDDVRQLSRILNPDREPGKLIFITRLGVSAVEVQLPGLLQAQSKTNVPCLWICDPMHGNTKMTQDRRKTRSLGDILLEFKLTQRIHDRHGTHLAGVHLELTGENVTECTGGVSKIGESDLSLAYETWCDPRLNYQQSLEFASQV